MGEDVNFHTEFNMTRYWPKNGPNQSIGSIRATNIETNACP